MADHNHTTEESRIAYYEARKSEFQMKYRWHGDGHPPAKWTADDGTIVYRCYADCCDD